MQSFKLNALKLWEELITQSWYPLLKPNIKTVSVKNVVILSKISFSPAKSQYANNICAKIQIDCLKTLRGVYLQTCYPILKHNLKIV